jgi:DNA-binding transcriptional ArsR family regulator
MNGSQRKKPQYAARGVKDMTMAQTSINVFWLRKGDFDTMREKVLDFLIERGYATTENIAFHFRVNPSDVSGRITELREMGLVIKGGQTRTRRGNLCSIWYPLRQAVAL